MCIVASFAKESGCLGHEHMDLGGAWVSSMVSARNGDGSDACGGGMQSAACSNA